MNVGYVIDLQHFSVNDGDGIRTTLFFAGCPLRCSWCSNPEGFTTMNKVMHNPKSCILCGRCTAVCPYGVGMNLNLREERIKCKNCGVCVKACPSGSRQNMIFAYTPEEIVAATRGYFPFFKKSGGGITYSGGECTMQKEFLQELVDRFYDLNIHQAMETCGEFEWEEIKPILEKIDLLFFDIKHMDSKKHRYFTGKGNQRILENLKRIGDWSRHTSPEKAELEESLIAVEKTKRVGSGGGSREKNRLADNIVVRIPTIVGVNAEEENIVRTARFVKQHLPRPRIELLPYHQLGEMKYETLGISKPSGFYTRPDAARIQKLEAILREEGVEVVRYR